MLKTKALKTEVSLSLLGIERVRPAAVRFLDEHLSRSQTSHTDGARAAGPSPRLHDSLEDFSFHGFEETFTIFVIANVPLTERQRCQVYQEQ